MFDFLRRENKRQKAIWTFMASSSRAWKALYFFVASGDRALESVLDDQLVRDAAMCFCQYESWLRDNMDEQSNG